MKWDEKERNSSTQLYGLIKMQLDPLGLLGELPRGFRETLIFGLGSDGNIQKWCLLCDGLTEVVSVSRCVLAYFFCSSTNQQCHSVYYALFLI